MVQFKSLTRIKEYNEHLLEETVRNDAGHYVVDLEKQPERIRLYWRIGFGKFFILIAKPVRK